ncbi:MAG: hypothetical protein B0D96_05175 [Candidatus Sedimenticola endophacoides]|uniref:SAM-dependent methyltransferase n=1 Tax=Candidatus Sedimenticola endophacoides TaxID=2548426 RepID=A0A657Q8U0_9GAMM|nr:MAG: hypothetical protein B0D94_03860 [Candidatus Sedimenticola endophacoides]OQX32898.1 MAG: hypothetical protein B0D84_05435 [Candidatus Sedimenticola endophacoides]OQX36053.1 MAG: hypothetical protein B0D96_05175 [Candidatus Sedimenticola endophacoides]OQX40079.1 MAG: hypothetical protein B0D89_09005 [Candidatus Sedimenticola endophacoides]OQX44255.1 MAG: hypothetical protein B0D83_00080 [Candidatus Sedimenticola endophacoides]
MQIDAPDAYIGASELDLIERWLPMRGREVLELGCGRAWMTRQMASRFAPRHIIATEVDRVQHQRNLCIDDLPNVRFVYGGAEAINLPEASVDCVLMLKSLHHVPRGQMSRALEEIARVLRPGGLAYISEPVYRGAFNDILKLFNDEREVRRLAFEALFQSVREGLFESVEQIFFNAPGHYRDFAEFEERMLRVTHTEHRIDAPLHQRIREAFERHLGPEGADFLKPSRVDLLRKPI